MRNELHAVLRASGSPPAPDIDAMRRGVRARAAAAPSTPRVVWWRSWTTAGLVAAGLACGLLSAAWRTDNTAHDADGHVRYLQLIDPLVRTSGAVQS